MYDTHPTGQFEYVSGTGKTTQRLRGKVDQAESFANWEEEGRKFSYKRKKRPKKSAEDVMSLVCYIKRVWAGNCVSLGGISGASSKWRLST